MSQLNPASSLVPRQHRPPGFVDHVFARSWTVACDRADAWGWLNDPSTFTAQVWPFRVEFVDGSGEGGSSGFSAGVLNVHRGPWLHAAGVITGVDAGADGRGRSRDLHYFFGSFVVDMGLIRPVRLWFGLEDGPSGGTILTGRLESHVRAWVGPAWTGVQGLFWSGFGGSMEAGVRRRARRAASR